MNNTRRRHIGQDIFSADQVIGKTLIAKANVPLKRLPTASAPVIYTAKKGETVGRVYSWVMDGGTLYWQFLDQYGKPYYAQHRSGIFSVEALQQQGAQTLEEIKEAQQASENPISTTIQKIFKPVALAAAAYLLIKAFR